MKAKVRNYKLESIIYDSNTCEEYEKISIGRELGIYFDENMYISKKINIEIKFFEILSKYIRKPISDKLCDEIENEINLTLQELRHYNSLFLESDMFFKPSEEMIILKKDNLFDLY